MISIIIEINLSKSGPIIKCIIQNHVKYVNMIINKDSYMYISLYIFIYSQDHMKASSNIALVPIMDTFEF
jgi:hypothetical protein